MSTPDTQFASPPSTVPPTQLFPPTRPEHARTNTNDTRDQATSEQQAQITDLAKQVSEIADLLRHLSPQTDKAARNPGKTDPDSDPTDPTRDPPDLTAHKGDLSDSDSDPSDPDLTAPGKSSTELLATYLLRVMDPAQHSTTGSRHTPTATLLEAWHNKINPEARKALFDTVCSPGPAAAQGLLAFQNELKAAIAPERATISAVTISALTRDPDHQRALHTENLLAIACGCSNMKLLKSEIRKISQTGNYNLDDIPTGSLDRSVSFHKFLPSYNRSSLWWQATLDLIASFWGSAAAYCEDDLKAEVAWRAANMPGGSGPRGTFTQGEDSAATLVAREAQLFKAREIASRGKPFCIPMDRARNLLTAAGPTMIEHFLNHLQVNQLELDKLSWGQLTSELIKADRAILDRRKTMGFLTPEKPVQTPLEVSPAHRPRRPKPGDQPPGLPPDNGDEDCWNHMYLGTCDHESCPRNHPGPPGSKMRFLATPEGLCRQFLQGDCDRGETCKFRHGDQSPDQKKREDLRQKILTDRAAAAVTKVF